MNNQRTHVVIVGGGFAGLNCALKLASCPKVRVTLIDKNNYQQFQPLLYQVASGLLAPSNAAFPLRGEHRHELTGPIAFAAWLGVHAALLTTTNAKVGTVMDWAWDYFGQIGSEQILDHPRGHAFDWYKDEEQEPATPHIEAQRACARLNLIGGISWHY
jgi:NADH dehydrogenase FAD-containing subunit